MDGVPIAAGQGALDAVAGTGWRKSTWLIAIVWIALLLAFFSDFAAMAALWWDSSTFNHILLIPAIIGWLVWQRTEDLRTIEPRGWWLPLVVFAGALFVWLLGFMAGLSIARQLALIVMLQSSLVAIIGPRAGAGLAFPIFYMLFLVPTGEEIVPQLQTITAHLTMFFLAVSQLPAHMEGVFITTPTGYFEVAEACSGVKFLIAMIAYGALVSNVCFKSWWRRLAFMALCIATPIIANGIRAWGTIYIAHFQGIAFAKSWDHVFYGWVFFAIVMMIVMAVGWRYFDKQIDDPAIDANAINSDPKLARLAGFTIGQGVAAAIMAALLGGTIIWAIASASLSAPMPSRIDLPQVQGWSRVPYQTRIAWEPRMKGANHRLLGRYSNGKGALVDVFYALYDKQEEGREAGGWGQGALMPESQWSWSADGATAKDGKSEQLIAPGPVMREAITYYRSGALITGSNMELKLTNIRDRLMGRAEPTMVLIVTAEQRGSSTPREEIDAFLAAIGPVGDWMDGIAQTK